MKIPQTFKLGSQIWTVEFVDTLTDSSDSLGQCLKDKNKILLHADLTKEKAEETFLHELIHACFEFVGLPEKKKLDEEEICSQLAPILYTVIEENKLFTSS